MNKKYLIILIVLMIFCIGCNNKEASLFKDGQTALENHEYDKAQTYLSDVLQQDSKNESARLMYMQASKMHKAEIYKDKGYYDKALECLEYIVNIDNGSRKIKIESQELKKELEILKNNEEEAANIRKENAKQVAKKAVQKSEQDFYIWQKNQESDYSEYENNTDKDFSSANIIEGIKDKLGELFNLQ